MDGWEDQGVSAVGGIADWSVWFLRTLRSSRALLIYINAPLSRVYVYMVLSGYFTQCTKVPMTYLAFDPSKKKKKNSSPQSTPRHAMHARAGCAWGSQDVRLFIQFQLQLQQQSRLPTTFVSFSNPPSPSGS